MSEELSYIEREFFRSHLRPITLRDLKEVEHRILSQISDFQAKVQANFDKISADLDAITSEIKSLNDQIQALQNSPGNLGPGDQASLDAIAAASQALADKADALVVPPVPPAPTK